MNLIEQMQSELSRRFPAMRFQIDAPLKETGEWFLDILDKDGSLFLVIQWRPLLGFGVSTPAAAHSDYGCGPDEAYGDSDAAMARIVHLIETGGQTVTV